MPHACTPSVLFQQISASSPRAKLSTCGFGFVRRVHDALLAMLVSDPTVYADGGVIGSAYAIMIRSVVSSRLTVSDACRLVTCVTFPPPMSIEKRLFVAFHPS